jgi:uncharacterized 2Fe-2S/4Fe-4S cluster protein (DUF4445 family)
MTPFVEPQSRKTPWLTRIPLEMTPPSLKDNTADVDRVLRGLKKKTRADRVAVDHSIWHRFPRVLREAHYRVDIVAFEWQGGWHVIDIIPATRNPALYGIAMDLGTSTVVLRLLDLLSGAGLDERAFPNPQIEIGTDILTRIHHAAREEGLQRLQKLLIRKINEEMRAMVHDHHVDLLAIAGIAASGNTTMSHFFLGLDPYFICREPYIPVVNRPGLIRAGQLGLEINPLAPVLVFPSVGSYFGGDLVAGILASGMTLTGEISLMVDVGTNAEVVIGNGEWLVACAGAAGPALEGGVASMGMMAGPGVIDRVRVDPVSTDFEIHTIDALPPIGICGSGLIDLVAGLFMAGMIDLRGKFVPSRCGGRLIETDGIVSLTVVAPEKSGTAKPLLLSQPDIDGLMRSKAAMYTILTTITQTVGVDMSTIKRFFVAGTFGAYINPRSAITLGMIPDLPLDVYVPVGNTSLEGASLALSSRDARDEIDRIRDRITYLELNVNQEFMNLFSAAKFIPHTDRSLFPSVGGSPITVDKEARGFLE